MRKVLATRKQSTEAVIPAPQTDLEAVYDEVDPTSISGNSIMGSGDIVSFGPSTDAAAEQRQLNKLVLKERLTDFFDGEWGGIGALLALLCAAGFLLGYLDENMTPNLSASIAVAVVGLLGVLVAVLSWRSTGTTENLNSLHEDDPAVREIREHFGSRTVVEFALPLGRDERIARLARHEAELIRNSKAYQSGELAKNDVQLDLNFEVNDIVTRAAQLCNERAKVITAAHARKTPVSPEAIAALAAAERNEQMLKTKIDAVEASLVRRVVALRRYRTHVVAIDEQLELVESLVHSHDGHDTLNQLLLGTADDEVSTSTIDDYTDRLPAVRESLNAAITALKDDTDELDLLLTH